MLKKPLKASLLTERVHTWLRDSKSARVLNRFRRICNLINESGEILSVVGQEIGPGPFSLVVEEPGVMKNQMAFSSWVRQSSEVEVKGENLFLGSLEIDLSEAECWDPKPDWEEIYRHRRMILRNGTDWISLLLRYAPSESLIHILTGFSHQGLGCGLSTGITLDTSDRFIKAAHEPIRCMMYGIIEDQQAIWEQGVRSLAGLGRGLTPAGDDFILGALYALRVIYPIEHAERIALSICGLATQQTSPLSAAYLRAAMRGEAVELWHQFLTALIFHDEKIVDETANHFKNVGYTSGFDALAGFGCVISQSMNPTPSPHFAASVPSPSPSEAMGDNK